MLSIVEDDLRIVKRWHSVQRASTASAREYLTGRVSATDPGPQLVFPMSAHASICFQEMNELLQEVGRPLSPPSSSSSSSSSSSISVEDASLESSMPAWSLPPLALTLAIVASDSSLSYYQISPDLLPPDT